MKKLFALLTICLLFACGGGDEKKKVEKEISGCTDTLANNYNPEANIDDGSCMSFVGRWSAHSKKGRIESYHTFSKDGTIKSHPLGSESLPGNWKITDGQLCIDNDLDNDCYKYEWISSNEFRLHVGRWISFKKEKSMQDYMNQRDL